MVNFIKGKCSLRRGKVTLVYGEGEGWVPHGSECEFIGGGSKSVILCLFACETVSPNVAQAGFKLMPVMNVTSSRFVLPGGEITIWSALS